MLHRLLLLMIACFCSMLTSAKITLPGIIGNNMVLQRGMAVPIWGWATPGAAVTLTFRNKTYNASADADGKWQLKLGVYKAGGPYTMELKGDGSVIQFANILIGDVWLASGQSNMEYGIQSDRDGADAIAHATDSMIHFFFVPWAPALQENKDIGAVPFASMNGRWIVCSPSAMAVSSWAWHGFSAPAYYFAQVLRKNIDCPVGLIGSYKGGTPAQAWVSISGLQQDTVLQRHVANHQRILASYDSLQKVYPQKLAAFRDAIKKWDEEAGRPQPSKPRPQEPARPDGGFGAPGNLFNGMIAPIIPYAIKGVIWYQGESNGDRLVDALEYNVLFPRLINDWREKWGQGVFPFLFVQLTNFRAPAKQPVEGIWPWVRDAQLRSLAVPKTGMAVTTDIGDASDIHPKSKVDVGKRLALAALKVAYEKDITFSGPVYQSMKVKGNAVEISFSNRGKGLAAMQKGVLQTGEQVLNGFAVAGDNKEFVWAKAVMKGNTVVVSADGINKPAAVRYNWADNPAGNLYNKEGLPASPFRTDDWNEQPAYSALWGKNGESWDRKRIPDFTGAGYKEGKAPLPDYPVQVNIKDMGAAGDGLQDDTKALRKAIEACAGKGTIFLPAGTYLITDSILIQKSELCIRGAGVGKTILKIAKGLEDLYSAVWREKCRTNTLVMEWRNDIIYRQHFRLWYPGPQHPVPG